MQIHGKQIKDLSIRETKLNIQGNLDLNNNRIVNLGLPIQPYDAANKLYVDSLSQGLIFKESCRVATSSSNDFVNISYSNISDIWNITNTPINIDGIIIGDGDRILIKNSTDARGNGIWKYDSNNNILVRTEDANNNINGGFNSEVRPGLYVFIREGNVNASTSWVLTNTPNIPAILGQDELYFVQFGGQGTYTAGEGLNISGNVFNVLYDNITIGIDSQNKLYLKDNSIQYNHLNSNLIGDGLEINNQKLNISLKSGANGSYIDPITKKLASGIIYTFQANANNVNQNGDILFNYTFSENEIGMPVNGSDVIIYINGIRERVSWGSNNGPFYITSSDGTIIRYNSSEIQSTDVIRVNVNTLGYLLTTDDIVTVEILRRV